MSEDHHPWRFRCRRRRDKLEMPTSRKFDARNGNGPSFIAWCARVPNDDDLLHGPLDIHPSIEVHFEFGVTCEEALAKLRREVLQ